MEKLRLAVQSADPEACNLAPQVSWPPTCCSKWSLEPLSSY